MIRKAMLLFMMVFSVCVLAGSPAAAVQEREPNDTPEQATPLGGDLAATGAVHRNDQDWFRLSLPAPSTVTARVTSSAGDCQMQVTGAVSKGGSTTGLGTGTGSVTFSAPAGDLYLRVNVANVAAGVCSGSEWCAIQCTRQGPFYLTHEKDGRLPQKVPATNDGKPLLPPITYQLTVSSSAAPTTTAQPGTTSTPPRPPQQPVAPPPPPRPDPPKPPVPPAQPTGTGVQEREPNDSAEQATPLGGAPSATGIIHMNDQDWYRLNLPAASTITARATASAGECQLQVAGFAGRGNSPTSLGGANGSVTFNAPAGDVYVRVSVANVAAGTCSGSDWCAIQCTPQGPWYLTPYKDGRTPQRVPATNDGKPLLPPITYQLAISSSATPPGPGQPPVVQPPVTQPRPDQPKPPVPPTLPKPQGELVQNPGMRGPSSWTVVEWYKPSNGKGEVSFEADGIRFRSQTGNTRIGVLQEINRDVSGCSSLVLNATVRADQQTLTGTGYNGREAPIAVFMKYTDMNGVVHDLLSENPSEPRNMFWNGFYYLDPTPPSISAHGTKVPRGAWHTVSGDLLRAIPKPRLIHFVGAEGAGWPVRDAKIGGLSLQCR